MTVGKRMRARLEHLTMSQSELARRVGLTQPAINSLIRGSSRSSAHLYKIARALMTTPEYLLGEIDDPDENAPPPPTEFPQFVSMPVVMPCEAALIRMFQALLLPVPAEAPRDEIAQTLAETLPIALARLQGDLLRRGPAIAGDLLSPIGADHDEAPVRRQASRT